MHEKQPAHAPESDPALAAMQKIGEIIFAIRDIEYYKHDVLKALAVLKKAMEWNRHDISLKRSIMKVFRSVNFDGEVDNTIYGSIYQALTKDYATVEEDFIDSQIEKRPQRIGTPRLSIQIVLHARQSRFYRLFPKFCDWMFKNQYAALDELRAMRKKIKPAKTEFTQAVKSDDVMLGSYENVFAQREAFKKIWHEMAGSRTDTIPMPDVATATSDNVINTLRKAKKELLSKLESAYQAKPEITEDIRSNPLYAVLYASIHLALEGQSVFNGAAKNIFLEKFPSPIFKGVPTADDTQEEVVIRILAAPTPTPPIAPPGHLR